MWKLLSSEKWNKNLGIFRIRIDEYINPRNNKKVPATILEADNSANVVATTPDGKYIFVRQFRFGIADYTLELPGGIVEKGEEVQAGIERELEEETGYKGKNWTYLGKIQANPVFMESFVDHWQLENATPNGTVRLDDGESVEVVLLTKAEVIAKVKNGEIAHPHTLTALMRVLHIWA